MFTRYVQQVMARAQVEKIKEPLSYFASIPGFQGVWAQGRTKRKLRGLGLLSHILKQAGVSREEMLWPTGTGSAYTEHGQCWGCSSVGSSVVLTIRALR